LKELPFPAETTSTRSLHPEDGDQAPRAVHHHHLGSTCGGTGHPRPPGVGGRGAFTAELSRGDRL